MINTNERIRALRRALDLTQQAFAERIGLKQNSIALIESGKRNISQQAILAICREFKVNSEWLLNGHGEMFAPNASDALEALAIERNLTHGEYILIEKFLNLKPEVRQGLIGYISEVAAALASGDISADASTSGIAAAEALYEKSLGFAPSMGSTASNTTGVTGSGGKAAGNE